MKSLFFYFICIITLVCSNNTYAQSPFGQGPSNIPVGNQSTSNQGSNQVGIGDTAINNNAAPTATATGNSNSAGLNQQAGNANGVGINQQAGIGLAAGDGIDAGNGSNQESDTVGFLQHLLSLLFGQQSQSSQNGTDGQVAVDQNQLSDDWQNQTPESVKITESQNTASPVSLTCKLNKKTIGGYLNFAICLMVIAIPIVISLLVLWFMVGALRYVNDSEHEAREQYKKFLIWGVLIIFVALSFVYILKIFTNTTGL